MPADDYAKLCMQLYKSLTRDDRAAPASVSALIRLASLFALLRKPIRENKAMVAKWPYRLEVLPTSRIA